MTFKEPYTTALKEYYPALLFEDLVSHRTQSRVRGFAAFSAVIVFLALVITYVLAKSGISANAVLILPRVYGIFFIVLPFWLIIVALQAFYYSYYFKGVTDSLDPRPLPLVSFELAHIIYRTSEHDVTAGFFASHEGIEMLDRCGITRSDFDQFLKARGSITTIEHLEFPEQEYIGLSDYVAVLYDSDKHFAQFLFSKEIQKKDFIAIADWISEREVSIKKRQRWWSRDQLGRIPGLGKNWSYGQLSALDPYMGTLPEVQTTGLEVHSIYGSKELEELEAVLVKNKGANAFLIGNDTDSKMQIMARLSHLIQEGLAYPELEHKRVVVFDTDLLTASAKTKQEFETELLKIMYNTAEAGNAILVIPDFPSFMASAQSLGTDIVSLLDGYFSASVLHIVGLSDVERFHSVLETNAALMMRFENIMIQDIDERNTVRVLQNEIIQLERQYPMIFTYPSLLAIAESADRYFPNARMPDSAVDLLLELAPKIAASGKQYVLKSDVLDLVRTKTGIPVGEINTEERDKLINLEKFLHQRIIGQDEAVDAIANAVRRARSGINNPDRPLASFLFLGPTGVGKTETTKALAEVFFGAEAKIERLDMSEYSGTEGLSKLIGSFDAQHQGVLSTMLREHPYGVLLLDEFEKTTPEVMNLFLQVLDEGVFSDMSGKKINARNLLIIATSNAGSDIIWESIKKGNDLSHAKELIIDSVVKARIFKPELVNRFDGVIVFHPLDTNQLEKIAELQLTKLKKRLLLRGFDLVINKELIQFIMNYGVDPKFGARPMNRAIQDKIEHIIADKMIRGEIKPGSEITLSRADLAA